MSQTYDIMSELRNQYLRQLNDILLTEGLAEGLVEGLPEGDLDGFKEGLSVGVDVGNFGSN